MKHGKDIRREDERVGGRERGLGRERSSCFSL
jgi:hypothetical protein